MRGGRQLPWFQLHLDPAAKPNAGAAGESAADDAAEKRIFEQLERMVQDKGGDKETSRRLFDDNKRVRGKYQRIRLERDELKAKVPAEGSIVLTGEDAKAFAEVQKLNIPVKDLLKTIQDGQAAGTELVTLRRKDAVAQVGELLGWDTDVLLDRLDHSKLHAEIATTTEKVDGKDVVTRTAKVRPLDKADAALVDLNDAYLEQHWPKFRGALVKGDAPAGGPASRPSPPPRPAPATRSGDTRIPPTADIDRLAEAQQATGLYAAF